MEYNGPPKPTNLSAERLAQILEHVQDAKEHKARAQQSAAERQVKQETQAAPAAAATTWKPRRAYINLGDEPVAGPAPPPAGFSAHSHRATPCDDLPVGAAAAAGDEKKEGERNYLDAPRDA